MHVDVATSWLYMLCNSVALFFFHFAILLSCAQNAKNALKSLARYTSGLLLVAVHLLSLQSETHYKSQM